MIKNPKYFRSPHAIAGVDKKEPVLVALSGGADSVSLLYNILSDSKENGYAVYAAHLNHNIRLEKYNNEAMRDECFCRELCDFLGVKLFVRSIDVPSLANELGESIEGAAREARYAFFSEIMESEDITLLVTAHNASDNFETQLFNLCRGASVSGLSGIPRVRELGGRLIVRPILDGTKSEILEFCRENGISFVTDSTNFESDATRNKIRNLVIPEIEKIFPSAQRAASRLARSAAEVSDYLDIEARRFLDSIATEEKESISIPCDSFNSQHPALRNAILARVFKDMDISATSAHIESVISLATRAEAHSRTDLPCGIECTIEDGEIMFCKSAALDVIPCDYEVAFDGRLVELEEAGFLVATSENNAEIDGKIYTLYTSATLKSDKIKSGILSGKAVLRPRRQGDRIRDGGNGKKIKKLMCDKGLPLDVRGRLPLLFLDGELVYAPMCAICDDAKMKNEEEIQIFIYKKL